MNIGIFTDTYLPQINGVVTSARMLENELKKLGHRVFIFTTSDPNAKAISPRVFRLPSMPLIFSKSHRLTFFYPPKLILRVKKFKLDIVHTYTEFPLGFFGKLISTIYKIPMVHTYHTMYEDYVHYVANGHLINKKGAQRFSRVFCNQAKIVIVPAEKTGSYLSEIGVKRPIRLIPSGLDFARFHPSRFSKNELTEARKKLGLTGDDRVIITVGRIAKEKSMDVLVGMMPALLKQVPLAKLLIVGDGPARDLLTQQAELLGIKHAVVFAGFKPWDEIGLYYNMSDIYATASTSETQGLTYIEAMASKIPVAVKNDASFLNYVRNNETGYVFDKNENAVDVIAYALTHPQEAKRVAERGYEAIQPLSAEVFALKLEEVYAELLKNSK